MIPFNSKHNLSIPSPIMNWDEAIPLGNGRIGCLIWGKANALRFSVDCSSLWDLTPCAGVHTDEFTYKELIRLARSGNVDDTRRIFDVPYAQATPTKIPAGKVVLSGIPEQNFTSELDLYTAEAALRFAGDSTLTSFISMQQEAGVIRVPDSAGKVTAEVIRPDFGKLDGVDDEKIDSVNAGSLHRLHYAPEKVVCDGQYKGFVQKITADTSYAVLVYTQKGAGETVYYYTVQMGRDEAECEQKARGVLAEAEQAGADALQKANREWWQKYWSISGVQIAADPTCEKLWYQANYFLAAGSEPGGAPLALQGVWTADDGKLPPWKGDYHHDMNTQFTYMQYLKSNHLEQGRVFLDFLWDLRGKAAQFAHDFYGTKGECLPGVMSIAGDALGGWPMYSLAPTDHIWVSQLFYEYYLITGDVDYLRDRIYPWFTQSAECISELLEEGSDGKLYLPVSSSPEMHDDTARSWMTPNSNYDLALLQYLFDTLVRIEKTLGIQSDRWQKMLDRLPAPALSEKKELMLSPTENYNDTHRHFSHAMAIYPLRQLDHDKPEDREIMDATMRRIVHVGTGQWIAFSVVWMAMLEAMCRNGEGAAYQLHSLVDNFFSVNGFNLNGDYKNRGICDFHYRPYTAESSFIGADTVQEMLLYTRENEILLLPAVPAEWLKQPLAFEHLRGENGLVLSFERDAEGHCTLTMQASRPGMWYLKNTDETITLKANESRTIQW